MAFARLWLKKFRCTSSNFDRQNNMSSVKMRTVEYLSPRLGIFLIYSEISHQSIVKAWS